MKKTLKKITAGLLSLTLLLCMLPLTVFAEEITSISLDEEISITVDAQNPEATYKFVPEEDGNYVFYSYNNINTTAGSESVVLDVYANLYDSNMSNIGYDDDGGEGLNFQIVAKLEKEQTYYLTSSPLSSDNTGSYCITVEKAVSATAITVNPSVLSGFVGNSEYLSVSFYPDNAITEDISWSSSNSEVASVENGNVTFLSSGTAVITATTENSLTATCQVTVKDFSELPEIELDTEISLSTDVDSGIGLYKFIPEKDGLYEFYSYNNIGASEDSIFDVKGWLYDSEMNHLYENDDYYSYSNFSVRYELTAGETYYFKATPYSSDEQGTYCVKLTYHPKATEIKILNGSSYTDYMNNYVEVLAKIGPDNAFCENVIWESDNEEVVSIDWTSIEDSSIYRAGLNLNSVGTAVITVTTESGLTDSITVTVKNGEAPEYIKFQRGSEITATVGEADNININFYPNGQEEVTLTSSNPEVVEVIDGLSVYYAGVGKATLTATTESGLTATCVVTVVEREYEAIALNEQKTVNITLPGTSTYFSFTPEETGYYTFYSVSNYDTYGGIQGRDYNDDCEDNKNFRVSCLLWANETYVLNASFYSSSQTGSYDVRLERLDVNSETGDLDLDGALGATDLSLMRLALLGKIPMDNITNERYDVTTDGSVNLKDLVHLKKLIAGIVGSETE